MQHRRVAGFPLAPANLSARSVVESLTSYTGAEMEKLGNEKPGQFFMEGDEVLFDWRQPEFQFPREAVQFCKHCHGSVAMEKKKCYWYDQHFASFVVLEGKTFAMHVCATCHRAFNCLGVVKEGLRCKCLSSGVNCECHPCQKTDQPVMRFYVYCCHDCYTDNGRVPCTPTSPCAACLQKPELRRADEPYG